MSIVLDYITDIRKAKEDNDEYTLETLRLQGGKTYVTLEDVALAVDQITEELTNLILDSQALQEERMKAVVNELSMNTKYRILESFDKVEDDLFKGDND